MGHPDFSEYSFYEVGRTDPFSVGRFVVFLEVLLELDHPPQGTKKVISSSRARRVTPKRP
jgi:hypothetical protein